jgi:ribose transport system substrate-binding protein
MAGFSKALAAGLAILVICAVFTGCGFNNESDSKRFIVLTNGDDQFWDTMREGMNKASEELNLKADHLVAVMDKNDGTSKGQIDKLKQYANQTDVAAVAISVVDAQNVAVADAMRALRKKGVIVLTIDSDIDRKQFRDARFAYLGTDNIIAGQELGKAAKVLRPDGGIYATFVGKKEAANAVERIGGFAQAATGFKEVDSLSDGIKLDEARRNVRTALDKHPDINTLVGIWSYNADAIVDVVKERGIRNKTTVVTFDCAPEAITDMKEGQIDAMIVQNPFQMGYLGAQLAQAMLKKDTKTVTEIFPQWTGEGDQFKTPDGDIRPTELRVVVPSDKSPLKPEMFRADIKFFYLDAFQKWLTERNLVGS